MVIKKKSSVHIANEIGTFFRGHNIIEYKSPKDSPDIDDFYKVAAYAGLYKAYGKKLDERKADDITVSILHKSRPRELFHYLKEHGYTLFSPYRGIYYVEGKILFPTQIIVTKELDFSAHIWLGALSERLEKQEMGEILENIQRLTKKDERELADSVLEVSVRANRHLIKKMQGDDSMCQALMEIMEPQIRLIVEREKKQGLEQGLERGLEQGLEKGRKNGIQTTVEVLRDFGHNDAEIEKAIAKKYALPEEEARAYLYNTL